MEELTTKAKDLGDDIRKLLDSYIKLAKIKAVENASKLISIFIAAIIVIFLLICLLFFFGMAASIWVGNLLGNMIAGYLIVAGFYLILIIIVLVIRKRIILPIIGNKLIRKMYE